MNVRLASLVVCALLSAPWTAVAQGRPIGLNERKGGRDHALELELDFSSVSQEGSDARITALLPKVYGSFGLTEELELEVTIPSVFLDYSPDDNSDPTLDEGDSTLLLGNPYLALFYAERRARSVARIGFGVALPALDLDDGTDFSASSMAIAMRGLADPWLYLPQALSFVVPGQVQVRVSSLVLGVDGALAFLIPTDDESEEEGDSELALQVAALLGIALDEVTIGARLQVASIVTIDEADLTQASVMPFVQADLDGGAFVHGGVLINLDAPFGVIDDRGLDVWALRVGGGGRF
jgi:hypothetical protein